VTPDRARPRVRRLESSDAGSLGAVVADAGATLARGQVAVLPAEGLYGYHVLAEHESARARLEALKPGDARRGWILLLAEPSLPEAWGSPLEGRAAELAARHWPGALTLVLPGPVGLPPQLRASDGTLAVRCPGSAFLRAVIAAAGGLVYSTSANRPGGPPPRTLEGCALDGADLAIDGGPLSGVPSTLARVVGSRVEILRSGAVQLDLS
jgi:L-threonylcarbamoyladenylate synthase